MNKQKEDMTTEELVKDLLEKEEELFSKQRIQEIQILISSLEIVLEMQKYIEFVKRNFPEYS